MFCVHYCNYFIHVIFQGQTGGEFCMYNKTDKPESVSLFSYTNLLHNISLNVRVPNVGHVPFSSVEVTSD